MFYSDPLEIKDILRLGDIVQGFPCCFPVIQSPSFEASYQIAVHLANQPCIVLSPCCSISEKMIVVSPIQKIPSKLISNPYFVEDFTRINVPIPARNSLPPEVWEKMPDAERDERLSQKEAYTFLELFMLAPHELLSMYEISYRNKKIRCSHYCIDFRHSIGIECQALNRRDFTPGQFKIAQLTPSTRQVLRDKLTYYYGRIPKEDIFSS